MSDWRDCIVSYFDLAGIGEKISAGNSEASDLMQRMHQVVLRKVSTGMPMHAHVYAWNDSALFLAFLKSDTDYEGVMRELNSVKEELDAVCPCYGICVKGQSMPEPQPVLEHAFAGTARQPRFIFLRTSSYAFANCFTIEKELGKEKKLQMDWYVDSRISDKIPSFPKCESHAVKMLPGNKERSVRVLKGRIWA